jgi:hypothetical protein
MSMTPEEFKNKTISILADPANIADVSKLLSEIVDDHMSIIADRDAKENLANDLSKKNKDLTDANMKLYLNQIGAPNGAAAIKNPNEPPKKPEIGDLFDEKGRLKKK